MSPLATLPGTPTRYAAMQRGIPKKVQPRVVYTVNLRSIPDAPFGRETFAGREDAESFIEELRREAPDLANELRIQERELDARRPTGPEARSRSELGKAA